MERSRESLAWAAGLFEGEGCFSSHKTGNRISGIDVSITSADEDVLIKFHQIMKNIGTINGPYHQTTPDGRPKKSVWKWHVCNFEGAQATIAMLWSWLGTRRKNKAKECLKAFHNRSIKVGRQKSLKENVKDIRELYLNGISQAEIARKFDASPAAISMICNNKHYKDI